MRRIAMVFAFWQASLPFFLLLSSITLASFAMHACISCTKEAMRMSQSRTKVRGVTVRTRTPLAQVQGAKKHSVNQTPMQQPIEKKEEQLKSLGFGERMLRNTAVCVAMLLCVLAAQSLNVVGATNATSLLSQVVSMDLSESLGSLKFVSNLIPESVAVFWNLGSERHALPTDAEVTHAFHAQEPWVGYGAGEVCATAAGEVMSVSVNPLGKSVVRIRHASGMETLYGNLVQVSIKEGDWVETGTKVGAAKELQYELRGEGRAMDPAPFQR